MAHTVYLNTQEAGERLHTSRRIIAIWIREGKLPGVRLPGTRKWLIRESDIEKLLQAKG